jgi:hypothetical protein
MDRRMVGFIALLAYVAIYPIFNQYSWLDFLKLGEPWNGLIEMYSQRPVRFVLWIFLIVHFIPERAIEWLRNPIFLEAHPAPVRVRCIDPLWRLRNLESPALQYFFTIHLLLGRRPQRHEVTDLSLSFRRLINSAYCSSNKARSRSHRNSCQCGQVSG